MKAKLSIINPSLAFMLATRGPLCSKVLSCTGGSLDMLDIVAENWYKVLLQIYVILFLGKARTLTRHGGDKARTVLRRPFHVS